MCQYRQPVHPRTEQFDNGLRETDAPDVQPLHAYQVRLRHRGNTQRDAGQRTERRGRMGRSRHREEGEPAHHLLLLHAARTDRHVDNGVVRIQLPLADGILRHARLHSRGVAHHAALYAVQPLPYKALLVCVCHGVRQGVRLVRQSRDMLGYGYMRRLHTVIHISGEDTPIALLHAQGVQVAQHSGRHTAVHRTDDMQLKLNARQHLRGRRHEDRPDSGGGARQLGAAGLLHRSCHDTNT